ncbi:MAG: hypothetical protein JST70_00750 [Bacteroidetes bacterium]|nr:hypothetical protein [Bacteroidota bacterium]
MMAVEENIQFTLSDLELFEKKVRNNEAELSEYLRFDKFIQTQGLSTYLNEKIKENGLSSFEDYLYERKRRGIDTSGVTGTILGITSTLKKYLTNTLY